MLANTILARYFRCTWSSDLYSPDGRHQNKITIKCIESVNTDSDQMQIDVYGQAAAVYFQLTLRHSHVGNAGISHRCTEYSSNHFYHNHRLFGTQPCRLWHATCA